MNFRDVVSQHLGLYKTEHLGIAEDGIFHYRGKDIRKSHILPIQHLQANILEPYRSRFFVPSNGKIKLHRYFHHLNSSQALCINLFLPLMVESKLELFLGELGGQVEGGLISEFEMDSDLEEAARKTSFDFFVQNGSARKIYVEVKYTEDGFGIANNDQEHRDKFKSTYLPLIDSSSYLTPQCRDEQFFLGHYQILRNLVHIKDNSNVVLLFPKQNKKVLEEAIEARESMLNEEGRARLKIVFLEDFVASLEDQCAGTSLDGYYQQFRSKYLP